jgi:hypothetical protein
LHLEFWNVLFGYLEWIWHGEDGEMRVIDGGGIEVVMEEVLLEGV